MTNKNETIGRLRADIRQDISQLQEYLKQGQWGIESAQSLLKAMKESY